MKECYSLPKELWADIYIWAWLFWFSIVFLCVLCSRSCIMQHDDLCHVVHYVLNDSVFHCFVLLLWCVTIPYFYRDFTHHYFRLRYGTRYSKYESRLVIRATEIKPFFVEYTSHIYRPNNTVQIHTTTQIVHLHSAHNNKQHAQPTEKRAPYPFIVNVCFLSNQSVISG